MQEARFRYGGSLIDEEGIPRPQYNSRGARRRLKFPIENATKHKAFIKFQPIITTPPTSGSEVNRIGDLVRNSTDNIMKFLGGEDVTTQTSDPQAQATSIDKTTAPQIGNIGSTDNRSSILNGAKKSLSTTSCVMYMPQSIQFRDGVNYSTADLGVMGASMQQMLEEGGSVFNSLSNSMGTSLGNVYDAISGNVGADAARVFASRVAGMAGKNGMIDGAVRSALKTSPVANLTLLFDKPALREFTFTFKMLPTTEEEAIRIEDIVRFFRTELYPESFSVNQGRFDIPFGYRFPNEIQVSFHYEKEFDGGSDRFIKIKPCYLKNVSTDFNAQSSTFYKGGYFQETNLSITLAENELLDKADIERGF